LEENTMTLIRYNPIRNLERTFTPRTFSQVMDSFFDEALQNRRSSEGTFTPSMDIIETENKFEIRIALPGFKKNDVKIDMENRSLTVSGERKMDEHKEGTRYHLVETTYGSFNRTISLPENVDRERVEASFENGILTVAIEKNEKAVTRNIQIK